MCGFVTIAEPGRIFGDSLLKEFERDLYHRGPDSGGRLSESGVALAFRRLAILDPDNRADQPMTDLTGRYTIVFNGEIYNFRTLRKNLQALGVRFRTTGDTEVILAGYAHWGREVFTRLEGMFALAIVDRYQKKIIAARDPFGIKPLYVMQRGKLTTISSEMRPLARMSPLEVDHAALSELLVFRFAAGRLSNLSGIESFPGGMCLSICLESGHSKEFRFDNPLDTFVPDNRITKEDALALCSDAVTKSVRDHLESDVGYTLQLSGGVDSSLVGAIAAKETEDSITSFGVHLPGSKLDEAPYRRQVVNHIGLRHHEISLNETEFADALPHAIQHMEGPVPHYGCVMLMLLCEKISKHSKVVLTGEGADEMFGGYKRYGIWRNLSRKGKIAKLIPSWMWPILQRWREVERYSGRDPAIFGAVYHDFLALNELFPDLVPAPGERESVAANFKDFRERMFAVDQSTYLPSLLMRQDKMAMASSVEARVPFTHFPLARIVNSVPLSVRAPGGETKPLLKEIAEALLPNQIIYRRKVGLTLPLEAWVQNTKGFGRYIELLTQPDCKLAAYAEPRRFRSAIEAFRKCPKTNPIPMPHLINLELWLRSIPLGTGKDAVS